MKEVWRDIPGYQGKYEISSRGIIRSKDRIVRHENRYGGINEQRRQGKVMRQSKHHTGYWVVSLGDGRKERQHRVHRILAEVFLGPANGRMVNHKNHDRGDNRLSNLEWTTAKGNLDHARRHGRLGYQKRTPLYKRLREDIKGLIAEGRTYKQAAAELGVSTHTIWMAVTGH